MIGPARIFLFESQFQFLNEEVCLNHYEKGFARGLFQFDRSKINQVWTDLYLWGLIGRIYPVELVRILCAFGCNLVVEYEKDSQTLIKSFSPVIYMVPIKAGEQPHYRHLYHASLENGTEGQIPLFLELADKLIIGSYYTTHNTDVDSQFPKFCKLLETDWCIGNGKFQRSLFELFYEGFPIIAQRAAEDVTLVENDFSNDTLRGYGAEESLFFVAS